jgi:hypothetical protein
MLARPADWCKGRPGVGMLVRSAEQEGVWLCTAEGCAESEQQHV